MSHLAQVVPIGRPVHQPTVAMLEDWLAMAKSGEIVHAGISGVTYDDCSITASSGGRNPVLLTGSLALLIRRVQDAKIASS